MRSVSAKNKNKSVFSQFTSQLIRSKFFDYLAHKIQMEEEKGKTTKINFQITSAIIIIITTSYSENSTEREY